MAEHGKRLIGLTTILSALVMLFSLGEIQQHRILLPAAYSQEGDSQPQRTPAIPREPPAQATNLYRIQQLEEQMRMYGQQQTRLVYLLFGNLLAILASLMTYIVTHSRGRTGKGRD